MTTQEEEAIRAVVRKELLGILEDAHEALGMKKDPTGMGRKALDGLAHMIKARDRARGGDSGSSRS